MKVVSPYAYELDFLLMVHYHRVVHVFLLDPASNNTLPGQHNSTPPPVIVDNEEEWHVEEVLDLSVQRKKLEYLIKWVGFDNPDWEPAIKYTAGELSWKKNLNTPSLTLVKVNLRH